MEPHTPVQALRTFISLFIVCEKTTTGLSCAPPTVDRAVAMCKCQDRLKPWQPALNRCGSPPNVENRPSRGPLRLKVNNNKSDHKHKVKKKKKGPPVSRSEPSHRCCSELYIIGALVLVLHHCLINWMTWPVFIKNKNHTYIYTRANTNKFKE